MAGKSELQLSWLDAERRAAKAEEAGRPGMARAIRRHAYRAHLIDGLRGLAEASSDKATTRLLMEAVDHIAIGRTVEFDEARVRSYGRAVARRMRA